MTLPRTWYCAAALVFLFGNPADAALKGRVMDGSTHKPIAGAIITNNGVITTTGQDGIFQTADTAQPIGVRAFGYRQKQANAADFKSAVPDIVLTPFRPKALYLSVYGIGSRTLRESALTVADHAGLNALVIDVKGDRGLIPYRSSVSLAGPTGANKVITVGDIHALVQDLHKRGMYLIARIVVFKDNPLAEFKPDLAVKAPGGGIFRDLESLAWVDPSRKEVWDYNIDIAVEAARNGFDEIQFDYVRFPDSKGVVFNVENTEQNRVDALSGFLKEARSRLAPFNVFLAADVFGYIPWNLTDTGIGQRIEKLATLVDYLCPMLYPSGFQFGIPGYRIPVAHSYEIVHLSLERAAQRAGIPSQRFRPWLQAFRDYAFDKREFDNKEVQQQIRAADEFGSNGWMLWNPRNVYPEVIFKATIP